MGLQVPFACLLSFGLFLFFLVTCNYFFGKETSTNKVEKNKTNIHH